MKNSRASIVEANSRVHLGLISMHAGAHRKYGGIGFALKDPCVRVDVRASVASSLEDFRPRPLCGAELSQLRESIGETCDSLGLSPRISVQIRGSMPTHFGMGSGTAIRLAVVEAIATLNGLSISQEQLVRYSGRGGTSGIGVGTYFSGGFVFDLGHAPDGLPMLPSSKMLSRKPPIALPRIEMPEWPLCICFPNFLAAKTQKEEVDFFNRATPLTAQDNYAACYEALFGVYGSILCSDYLSFCKAVNLMQGTTWKALEWREYGPELMLLKEKLFFFGVDCVAMSSLGPALVCFLPATKQALLVERQEELGCTILLSCPTNFGRRLSSGD